MPPTEILRIKDREFPVDGRELGLILRGQPPEVRTFLNFEVRTREVDGWQPKLDSASWIPLPDNPLFRRGAEVSLDVPLLDEEGSSFNVMLYVFDHEGVHDVRLALKATSPGQVRLRLTGRAAVNWNKKYGRNLAIELETHLTLSGIGALDAKSPSEGRAILTCAGIPSELFVAKKTNWGYDFKLR